MHPASSFSYNKHYSGMFVTVNQSIVMYRVGQKFHLGFFRQILRKTWMDFWANLILLLTEIHTVWISSIPLPSKSFSFPKSHPRCYIPIGQPAAFSSSWLWWFPRRLSFRWPWQLGRVLVRDLCRLSSHWSLSDVFSIIRCLMCKKSRVQLSLFSPSSNPSEISPHHWPLPARKWVTAGSRQTSHCLRTSVKAAWLMRVSLDLPAFFHFNPQVQSERPAW